MGTTSILGMRPGDEVEFNIQLNEKGQAMAVNVRKFGEVEGQEGDDGETYSGRIKTSGPKFGFIECPLAMEKFGNDVFANAASIAGMCIGDQVEFGIRLDAEGRPAAVNVRMPETYIGASGVAVGPNAQSNTHAKGWSAPKGFGGASLGSGSMQQNVPRAAKAGGKGASDGETYYGKIKRSGTKFGFIECPLAMERFGNDVFVPTTSILGMRPGEELEFNIQLNEKGRRRL